LRGLLLRSKDPRERGREYFNVNPRRYSINKAHHLPPLIFNPYTSSPISRHLHCRHITPTHFLKTFELQGKRDRWTTEDVRIFLEKFFIYGCEFRRIADFLPEKSTEDLVGFYYLIKKHVGLTKNYITVKESVGNKL
jgi:hypothetical protein